MTWSASPSRARALVALVAAALLASTYVVGRTLAVDQSRHRATGAAGDVNGRQHTHQPGPAATASGDRSAGSLADGPDATATAGGGIFGAHTTTGTRQVALTFDDGPDPRYTPQVLGVLRQFRVHATFCVVGENAQRYPELVQAIVADGHTLCNHSWNHNMSLGRRSPAEIRADLLRANAAIRAAVPDAPICWYRQPGGMWTYPVVSGAHELGMTSLHWSVDPADWQVPGAGRITAVVVGRAEPGSVVLLHDGGGNRQGTVDALHRILPDLTSRFELAALPVQAR